MKQLFIVFLLFPMCLFAQLETHKSAIDYQFMPCGFEPKEDFNGFLLDKKLSPKKHDTIEFYYKDSIAKIIKCKREKGFSEKSYTNYLAFFVPEFKTTNTFKKDLYDYIYDSKKKILIVKQFTKNSFSKTEVLTKIIFMSDFESIKQIIPQIEKLK